MSYKYFLIIYLGVPKACLDWDSLPGGHTNPVPNCDSLWIGEATLTTVFPPCSGKATLTSDKWHRTPSGFSLPYAAVKRLMREAQELHEPTEDYFAQPLDDNLFEWHFTVRGPDDTAFEGGVYHGRILLPPQYPMKPPSIIMLTVGAGVGWDWVGLGLG